MGGLELHLQRWAALTRAKGLARCARSLLGAVDGQLRMQAGEEGLASAWASLQCTHLVNSPTTENSNKMSLACAMQCPCCVDIDMQSNFSSTDGQVTGGSASIRPCDIVRRGA